MGCCSVLLISIIFVPLQLTWADFMFAGLYDHMKGMMRMPDLGQKYPALQQVKDRVYSFPKVKAYADAVAAKLNS